jgi:hypothetical protein
LVPLCLPIHYSILPHLPHLPPTHTHESCRLSGWVRNTPSSSRTRSSTSSTASSESAAVRNLRLASVYHSDNAQPDRRR